jgi:GDP-L-fucose synthase
MGKKIFIAGASGMVGSALIRAYKKKCGVDLLTPSRKELDLTVQCEVLAYLKENRPDTVIVAAAKVGGIWANNSFPAEFLYHNLMIASNLIHGAHLADVPEVLFLGSSCIYPRMAPQPIQEASLLSGPLEPTNEAYAIAKIAGVKLCQYYSSQYGRRYISAMPTNLYGPSDHYHPMNSHVIPGLIGRFHAAKESGRDQVTIWGTGRALREFLFVDDLAEACLFILDNYEGGAPINVGSGQEVTILELAHLIKAVLGFEGHIINDLSKPDGTPRKILDSSKLQGLGWKAKTPLLQGLKMAYADFISSQKHREWASVG